MSVGGDGVVRPHSPRFTRKSGILYFSYPHRGGHLRFRWYWKRWGRWSFVQSNVFASQTPANFTAGLDVAPRRKVKVKVFVDGFERGTFRAVNT